MGVDEKGVDENGDDGSGAETMMEGALPLAEYVTGSTISRLRCTIPSSPVYSSDNTNSGKHTYDPPRRSRSSHLLHEEIAHLQAASNDDWFA
jgi:hypothetical protein